MVSIQDSDVFRKIEQGDLPSLRRLVDEAAAAVSEPFPSNPLPLPVPKPDDIDELISRLETATEGSRELDGRIFLFDNPKTECVCVLHDGKVIADAHVPRYTVSLDAAVTLVPGDCDWLVNSRGHYACVWESKETGRYERWEASGTSLPLGLRITALKARQHEAACNG
jgi:hypothetical protein